MGRDIQNRIQCMMNERVAIPKLFLNKQLLLLLLLIWYVELFLHDGIFMHVSPYAYTSFTALT